MKILPDGTNVTLTGSATPSLTDVVYDLTVPQVLAAVDAGRMTAGEALTAEIAGKARGSLIEALQSRTQ